MPTIKKSSTSMSNPQTATQAPPVAAPVSTAAAPTPASAAPAPAAGATPTATPTDPNAALEQYVEQSAAALDTVEVGLGNDPALTPGQKRHALKFRKGGDKIIGQLANLAQQQQLESPALNATNMIATLGKAQALQPLSDRVAAFAKHVDDVIFKSQSDSLAMAQQIYALLQRRALIDNELATAMMPIVTFFARKPKPKAPGALTKSQTKATAKAVTTLKKNAPEMLQEGGTAAAVGQVAAVPAAGAGATGTAPTGVGHP